MDDNKKPVRVSVSNDQGGSFWVAVAILLVFFYSSDELISLRQAAVEYLIASTQAMKVTP